jgi:GTP-binding protein
MSVGFVDEVEVHVVGGHGGAGCVAFRREKFVPRGGPSGGDGGDGGSVVLVASEALNTLSDLRHRGTYRGKRGEHGEGSDRHGKRGEGIEILVPAGTLVHDRDTGELLCDLREQGERFVVAPGGLGGRGNARFATSRQRAPRHADPGLNGVERWLRLELKLLADAGLLGLPNAGKSTLISRISAARPKIAGYPFTTLVPNLGVVDWGEYKSYVVADIPGLIEGSHEGQGLGGQFLRHVERTAVLVHLVDCSDTAEEEAEDSIRTIEEELRAFDAGLLTRPRLLVASKLDASSSDERKEAVRVAAEARGLPFLEISAVSGLGLRELVPRVGELVQDERARWAALEAEGDDAAPAEED